MQNIMTVSISLLRDSTARVSWPQTSQVVQTIHTLCLQAWGFM